MCGFTVFYNLKYLKNKKNINNLFNFIKNRGPDKKKLLTKIILLFYSQDYLFKIYLKMVTNLFIHQIKNLLWFLMARFIII